MVVLEFQGWGIHIFSALVRTFWLHPHKGSDIVDEGRLWRAGQGELLWQLKKPGNSETRQVFIWTYQSLMGNTLIFFWRKWAHGLTTFFNVPLSSVCPFQLHHTKDWDFSTFFLTEHIQLLRAFQRNNSLAGYPWTSTQGQWGLECLGFISKAMTCVNLSLFFMGVVFSVAVEEWVTGKERRYLAMHSKKSHQWISQKLSLCMWSHCHPWWLWASASCLLNKVNCFLLHLPL